MMTGKVMATAMMMLACTSVALAGGPTFVKWAEAKKLAAATGKPIAVYATVNEEGGGC
jgi:hypothetical protein